jgi:hypothetical protein
MSHDPLPAPISAAELEAMLPPKTRHDGWTPARQQEFIEVLADTACVRTAARRVGMTPQSAYRLRRHPDAADFRKSWDLAVEQAWLRIKQVALNRVLNGEEVEIVRDGVVVAVQRKPCDPKLLIHMLDRARHMIGNQESQYRDLSQMRDLIDDMPDREGWVGERLDPLHFREMERVPEAPRLPTRPPEPAMHYFPGRPRARKT